MISKGRMCVLHVSEFYTSFLKHIPGMLNIYFHFIFPVILYKGSCFNIRFAFTLVLENLNIESWICKGALIAINL